MKKISLLIILIFIGRLAYSQINVENMEGKLSEFLQKEKADSSKKASLTLPISSPDVRLDSTQLGAWKDYYSYMKFGYQHRKNVFSWQLISSKIIFFVVIFLVLMGVYFSWLQFIDFIKRKKTDKSESNALQTELSATTSEIKISSPVLGVIILLISLMFFFLYLKYVYPIFETF